MDAFSELNFDDTGNQEVCINSVLLDELLELILVYLPLASIIRAGLVCKKWRDITVSKRFLWIASQTVSQKPWYSAFIRNSEDERIGYAYDPVIHKWQRCDFLDMLGYCNVDDSSDGLVCYMKDYAIYVCNPITKECTMLQEPPGFLRVLRSIESGRSALLNISVNRRVHTYIVSILADEVDHGKLSVRKYDSATMKWTTSETELLTGWSLGRKSVICNMVLYFLIYSTVDDSRRYGLLAYNFSSNSSSCGTLTKCVIPLPCLHIYCLLNIKDKVIVVGSIDSPVDERFTLEFGIWLLEGQDWQIICCNTGHCFQHRGEFYGSRGAEDLIYIHEKYARLVVFDMNLKQWELCQTLSMKGMFNGFCFQPRLDISPYSQCPHEITSFKETVSQKPWFFMFNCNFESEPNIYAYDPILQHWIGRDFLDMMESYMFRDSSDGLVCYMKDHTIHVCNPITREHKMLQEPPGFINLIEYGYQPLINISVNRTAHNYIVTVLSFDCDEVSPPRALSVQMYDSATLKWTTSWTDFPNGWTTGLKSVICNRVLYFLIESIGGDSKKHGLLAYNLWSTSSSHETLTNSIISLPCSRICGLMNLKENLIMVGSIDSPCGGGGSISGFSIWHLEGKDWQVISRMTDDRFEPNRFELDCHFEQCGDLFESSGADDLIYIHRGYDPGFVFDMKLKQWKLCQKFPMAGGSNGFCFQPRLDISPYSQPQRDVISSKMSLWNVSQTVSQQPWFFTFNGNSESEPNAYAYDPVLHKWEGGDYMDMMKSDMFCDSSDGLVCYIKDSALHVCNPLTWEHKMLPDPPGVTCLSEFIGDGYPFLINISVNRRAHNYNVSVVKRVFGYPEELSVQIYDSTTMKWATFQAEILRGWGKSCKSVICNMVLYILMDSTGDDPQKHGLVAFNFSSYSSSQTIIKSFIPLPCKRIYGLVNLKENLIVVGGIEFGVSIIGFNIWLLEGNDWHVISRITDNFFQDFCFRNYENFFGSSGAENLIYIHGHYDPGLVVFDMSLKRWKTCEKFPTAALDSGFCFQPRLDISP